MKLKQSSKEKLINFLKEKKPKKFSIRKLHKALGISYPTAQKYVDVLHAENKIKIDDLGNTKLVYI